MAFLGERWAVARLIARCCKRPADRAAWEEFVRRYHPTIQSSVSRVLYSEAGNIPSQSLECSDAEVGSLVEAVYSRLVENRSQALKSFRIWRADSVHNYLTMISINVVLDHSRQNRAQAEAH
jgi:DNA-directed RNA polymerase specialized sigma24 family protein